MRLTNQEWAEVISIMNSAPLQNMQTAVHVSGLIAKVQDHAASLEENSKKETGEVLDISRGE